MNIDEIEKIPFVFIVGRGRSGTTLLQNIIDANEQAILPRESKLIIHLKQKYFKTILFTDDIIDTLIVDLYKDRFFKNSWKVDKNQLTNKLKSYPKNRLDFPIVCKIIYLSYTSLYGTGSLKIIGDKNPIYSVFIPELLEVFPNAKFIHLIRDYRDNVVSNRKAFGNNSVEFLGYGWLFFNLAIEKAKRDNKSNFYTIKYEDLVTHPQQKIVELCEFLSLDFNEDMIHFNKKINAIFKENTHFKIVENHKNLANPINNTQVEKYKTNLTLKEIETLDCICSNYGKQYGYFPLNNNFKPISIFKRLFYSYKNYQIIMIVRLYYNSPFILRDILRFVSEKLFNWFKITTKYNKIELMLLSKREQTN